MARASDALVGMAYFEAEELSLKALGKARVAHDFDRMSRICLPLQEARRQIRQIATDAGLRPAVSKPVVGEELLPGCYLFEPPRIGIEARQLRERAVRRKVPVMSLAREPVTKAGLWPVVGVGDGEPFPVSVRTRIPPPEGGKPTIEWFLGAQEALGDAAIAMINPKWPADHRVDDFLELLPAIPDHEKLIQALARACAEAVHAGVSELPRRPGMRDVI
ncbi:MAG: hypothetical protein ACOYN0_14240 [Phycisphaerales bacterium]